MENNSVISGKEKDLGGFSVYRVLPVAKKRQIGPFVFLDHMGPLKVDDAHHLDVRPHPHIGLATVTYLFAGQGFHRDSIGSRQKIQPGDLNWMTAGRGIVHSERTPPEELQTNLHKEMHGVQIWVALPVAQEECAPSFVHWPKEQMPVIDLAAGVSAKIMIGEFSGHKSPVQALSRSLFMDIHCLQKYNAEISFNEKELGLLLVTGRGQINGQNLQTNDLIFISETTKVCFDLEAGARIIVIGGEPFPEPRYMWWNFVSSRKERIREAAENWRTQSMGQVVDEHDFIPLPDIPLPV